MWDTATVFALGQPRCVAETMASTKLDRRRLGSTIIRSVSRSASPEIVQLCQLMKIGRNAGRSMLWRGVTPMSDRANRRGFALASEPQGHDAQVAIGVTSPTTNGMDAARTSELLCEKKGAVPDKPRRWGDGAKLPIGRGGRANLKRRQTGAGLGGSIAWANRAGGLAWRVRAGQRRLRHRVLFNFGLCTTI